MEEAPAGVRGEAEKDTRGDSRMKARRRRCMLEALRGASEKTCWIRALQSVPNIDVTHLRHSKVIGGANEMCALCCGPSSRHEGRER